MNKLSISIPIDHAKSIVNFIQLYGMDFIDCKKKITNQDPVIFSYYSESSFLQLMNLINKINKSITVHEFKKNISKNIKFLIDINEINTLSELINETLKNKGITLIDYNPYTFIVFRDFYKKVDLQVKTKIYPIIFLQQKS